MESCSCCANNGTPSIIENNHEIHDTKNLSALHRSRRELYSFGPSVAVMPAPGKPFEVFQQDDAACRGYAQQSIGTSANDQAAQNVVGGAVIGTALGALAGAAIGNHRDAGVGAAFGLLAGTSMGASSGNYAGSIAQRRYNIAYSQCMYAKGNQVPGYAAPRAIAPPPPPPPQS
jgi:YMGG-like Gly-zipper